MSCPSESTSRVIFFYPSPASCKEALNWPSEVVSWLQLARHTKVWLHVGSFFFLGPDPFRFCPMELMGFQLKSRCHYDGSLAVELQAVELLADMYSSARNFPLHLERSVMIYYSFPRLYHLQLGPGAGQHSAAVVGAG